MCHACADTPTDVQLELAFGVSAPAEAPDAPWIRENWHTGFYNAVKIGKIEQKCLGIPPIPPNFVENDRKWPFFSMTRDMAEWFYDHVVVGVRKHIDPHTGVISVIFRADTHETYVADDFDPALRLVFDPRSTADDLYRLPKMIEDHIRAERVRKVDLMRGKL